MRVRISYGMDIEDVPSRASELLCETVDNLNDAVSALKRCRDGAEDCTTDFKHIIDSLDKIRQSLAGIDQSVQDVEYILEGLQNYYNGEANVSDRRPTMDTGGNATEET